MRPCRKALALGLVLLQLKTERAVPLFRTPTFVSPMSRTSAGQDIFGPVSVTDRNSQTGDRRLRSVFYWSCLHENACSQQAIVRASNIPLVQCSEMSLEALQRRTAYLNAQGFFHSQSAQDATRTSCRKAAHFNGVVMPAGYHGSRQVVDTRLHLSFNTHHCTLFAPGRAVRNAEAGYAVTIMLVCCLRDDSPSYISTFLLLFSFQNLT